MANIYRDLPTELQGLPGIGPLLYRRIVDLYSKIYEVNDLIKDPQRLPLTKADLEVIRKALQAGGATPINVNGLLGVLSQAQIGGAPEFDSFPVINDPRSQDGALGVLEGALTALYRYTQTTREWLAVAALGIVKFLKNGVLVASRQALNFVDGGGITWTVADDAINAEVDISATVAAYTTVEDEGVPLTQRTTMNFVGAGVTAADSGGETVVTIPGGIASAYTTVEDEGSGLTQRSTMNFTGAGVTASDSGGKTVVNIPGGSGSGLDLVTIWALNG